LNSSTTPVNRACRRRSEVYVDTFPPGRGKRQVSALGGNGPQWRGDGSELYYHAADGGIMATPITPGSGTIGGPATKLFRFRPAATSSRRITRSRRMAGGFC